MDLLDTSIKGRPAPTLSIVNALAASVMALQRQGARLYMQRLICFFRSVCKLISQWICNQNQPIRQPALLSKAIRRRLKSQCFCMFWIFFFKDNINEWVTFACDGKGPADESKRMKRVQGWSRLNWFGDILIIVSWHFHFNKLLMPLTPVCCFAN